MGIGDPQRVIRVAPLDTPAEEPGPVQEPLTPIEAPKPVPASERTPASAARVHRSTPVPTHARPM